MQTTLRNERAWLFTPKGEKRGYIQPEGLRELWFHTGTVCNLSCPFCLEGSKPGDTRLGRLRFDEVRPWIEEAVELGVSQFSFTGGEPFVIRDLIRILDHALDFNPCLVLTNATDPLLKRLAELGSLRDKRHPLSFRVSLDHPDPGQHDEGRGEGTFEQALQGLRALHDLGFQTSVARQVKKGEDRPRVEERYAAVFRRIGLPSDLRLVGFPEFHTPHSSVEVPQITENCMTTYQTVETRKAFMCNYSKMVIKKDGQLRVYACTLVDDDPEYDQGGSLRESLGQRVMLKHHRCFSCFSFGCSCSET